MLDMLGGDAGSGFRGAMWGSVGSQGLFKSPWILLNSPNFCNFAVAFATAMSTLLLGDYAVYMAVQDWL